MPCFHDRTLEILSRLPADLPWLVAFDHRALLTMIDPAILRRAWLLPDDAPLRPDDVVVLTAAGKGLVGPGRGAPHWIDGGEWPAPRAGEATLLLQYGKLLAPLSGRATLCIGLGRLPGQPPAAMAVEPAPDDPLFGAVRVRSTLPAMPDTAHYELLAGCGVQFEGVTPAGNGVIATFRNRMPTHLTAALASGFERTEHCNLFFLRGQALDAELRDGLIQAGTARIRAGAIAARMAVLHLAVEARRTPMRMTAVAPPPAPSAAIGDLVPLGLLLRALRGNATSAPEAAASTLLERFLDARRTDGLWPFQTGRLATATDSALVLMGRGNVDAIALLETFADGLGGYLPQHTSPTERRGRMQADPAVEHWTQADLGTTLLVRTLRREAGLAMRTSTDYLAARFETRSALFFANPFFVDWLFAQALTDDPDGGALRRQLADEVAAAVEPDGGFGRWDRSLSTALAILALAAAGRRGRLMHLAQLRLLDLTDAVGGDPPSTPFYSTLCQAPAFGALPDCPGMLRFSTDPPHELTLYEDTFRIIGTAIRTMALAEPADAAVDDRPSADHQASRHARYRTPTVAAYVRDVALPPYLSPPPGLRRAVVA